MKLFLVCIPDIYKRIINLNRGVAKIQRCPLSMPLNFSIGIRFDIPFGLMKQSKTWYTEAVSVISINL